MKRKRQKLVKKDSMLALIRLMCFNTILLAMKIDIVK